MTTRPFSRSGARKRVLILGATGAAGPGIAAAVQPKHETIAMVRPEANTDALPRTLHLRFGRPHDPVSLARDGFEGDHMDAVVLCPGDDRFDAKTLTNIKKNGCDHVILISDMTAQRALLAHQKELQNLESELVASGMAWSIVRPSALFHTLTEQIGRVQDGLPFVVAGDGRRTAMKPISIWDLGRFVETCLTDPKKKNTILPIGGPDPAMTPRDIGEMIFRLTGRTPKFREVPHWRTDLQIQLLEIASKFGANFGDEAAALRRRRYDDRESKLVLNPESGRYEARSTPGFGEDHLEDYFREIIESDAREGY